MKFVPKFQMGGSVAPEENVEEAPVEQPAPAGQGQDPLMMIAQAAAQALQTQNCEMAMQVCQAMLQLLQQAGPAPAEQGTPVFAKGGVLKRRMSK